MKTIDLKWKVLDESRIKFIIENADPKQWFYVPTKENPADDSSRGLKDVHLEKTKRLFEGLRFLEKSESECECFCGWRWRWMWRTVWMTVWMWMAMWMWCDDNVMWMDVDDKVDVDDTRFYECGWQWSRIESYLDFKLVNNRMWKMNVNLIIKAGRKSSQVG